MSGESTVRGAARHGAIVFAGVVGGYGATYVYYVLCARGLGVEPYGLLSAMLGAVLLSALPSSMVTIVVARAAAMLRAASDDAALAGLARRATRALFPALLVAAGAGVAGGWLLARLFRVGDPVVIGLMLGAAALTAVLPLQRAVLQGAGDFAGFAFSNILEGAVRALCAIAVLAGFGGLRFAVAGFLVAAAAAFALNIVLLGRVAPAAAVPPPRVDLRRSMLAALPLGAIMLMTFLDVIVIRSAVPAREAGLYVTAALVGRALITATTAIPTVLLPHVVHRAAQGRSAVPLLGAALGAGAVVAAVVTGICFAVPRLVLLLVGGAAYVDAAPLLVPYALAASALAGATIVATYLAGVHRSYVGIPVAVIAVAEAAAIIAFAHHAGEAVRIVLAGHSAAFFCCVAAALISGGTFRRATVRA